MTREEALVLVNSWTKNKNLVKHMLAVEAEMRALAREFKIKNSPARKSYTSSVAGGKLKINVDDWGLAGLIHDADYEKWPDRHPKKLLKALEENNAPSWLYNAVETHAWKYNDMEREPKTKLEWALYTCDELSGFIIACALVRPSKKLVDVTVASVLKKWLQKSFAKGVHREQIEYCEDKLNIKLPDFIEICLTALQSISGDLGL